MSLCYLSPHPRRALVFTAASAALLLASYVGTARVRVGESSLLQHLTHNTIEPGGEFQSLRRFREAAASEPVDAVFFGSSHAYRGFDPRLFEAEGVSALNLGSTNQTPLVSRYLLERHLPRLSPKLVVFEIYYPTLSGDGLEAFRDLAANTPWSSGMLKLAFETRELDAVHFAAAKGLGLVGAIDGVEQRAIEGERYHRGYCESRKRRTRLSTARPFTLDPSVHQLAELRHASALARAEGARVVWVTHPLPADHRERAVGYEEVNRRVTAAAAASDVPYWDFQERVALDPLAHFADFHHLNAEGVRRFNQAFIAELRAHGLIE